MGTEFWVLVWDSLNGEVVERKGPYATYDEAWSALEEEVTRLRGEGWDCSPSPSDPPGYTCISMKSHEIHEHWLTVEERLEGLPP